MHPHRFPARSLLLVSGVLLTLLSACGGGGGGGSTTGGSSATPAAPSYGGGLTPGSVTLSVTNTVTLTTNYGAINVGLAFTEESLVQQFGKIADFVRPGVLSGSDEQILDRIGNYVEAGADQVNIALRAPFDLESLARFAGLLHLSAK